VSAGAWLDHFDVILSQLDPAQELTLENRPQREIRML
jgi:hypothetical protein